MSPPDSEATASATSRVGKYQLLQLLGKGGMAEVWRAAVRGAAGFEKHVALKTILSEWARDQAFVTMFIDEARLSATLDHPNIVATLDFGFAAGRYFIAMEMVEGASLRACEKHLARRGLQLGIDLAAHVTAEVAAGLHCAHQATDREGRPLDIVHRDVNPANVLISTHGEVKLTDFGIAKAAGRGTHTEAGALKGKIPYMSPEQAWGRPLDARSDVYALGLMLYELSTARRAIEGPNEMVMLERARTGTVDLAQAPPELGAILGRALGCEPDARYPTAQALRDDLRALLGQRAARDLAAELSSLVLEVKHLRETGNLPVLIADPAMLATTDPDVHSEVARSTPVEEKTPPAVDSTAPATPDAIREADDFPSIQPRPTLWATVALGTMTAIFATLWLLPGPLPASEPLPSSRVDPPIILAPPPAPAVAPSATPEPIPEKPTPKPRAPGPGSRAPIREHRAPMAPGATDERATLRIQVQPWGQVWLDGRALGMTPLPPVQVAPGAHTVVAENPTHGRRELRVQVAPGEGRHVKVDFAGAP